MPGTSDLAPEPRGRDYGPGGEGRLGKILFSREAIHQRVVQLAAEISDHYAGRDLLLLGMLRGAVPFLSDLVRAISIPCAFDFMAISRYQRGGQGPGEVRITRDAEMPLEGRHVILVEDVVDTGMTVNYLLSALDSRGPASLKLCTLLDRPHLRLISLPIQYVGFTIPNDYLVGYGLGFQEQFRQLPHICFLKPDQP